ncbi:MAG: DUF3108 domain-containing protein [Ignavibacteria bacterium]|nr:DUF3108 domain-containing protein [Ignavibacteria bacterium]
MKRLLFLILFYGIIANISFAQKEVLNEGEELNYIVYYGFIKLGEVKMKIISRKTEGDKIVFNSRSEMKTFKGIPFVSLNSVFESEMVFQGMDLYSRRFKATEYKDDGNVIIEYKFNYDSNFVYVRKDNKGNIEKDEKISFNKNIKFQDGLSLFYKARINSYASDNFIIPVFMNEAETSVNYYFSSKKDNTSIDLFSHDILTVRCNGVANFEGVFGLSGEFVGWFSYDEARIPLKAQMNVIIGNVTLELDTFRRAGWKP